LHLAILDQVGKKLCEESLEKETTLRILFSPSEISHRNFRAGLLRYNDRRHGVLVLAKLSIDDQLSAIGVDMQKPAALCIIQ